MMVWVLLGTGVWLGLLTGTCTLLSAAKRGDAALQAQRIAAATAVVDVARPHLDGLLGAFDGAVIALREPRPAGQVVAIAARGQAAPLVGRALAPDDFLTARAALSGHCETRGRAAAAPLRCAGETIGAIGMSMPAQSPPISQRDLARLLLAADAISRRLSATAPASLAT